MKKQEFRTSIRTKRKNLPETDRRIASGKICDVIAGSDVFAKAKTVLFYIPTTFEVNLLPLMKLCRESGKTVAVPRTDEKSCTMVFCKIRENDTLKPGAFGIPEPGETAEAVVPDGETLCLVPGLAFDLFGNRLGSGKGFYDRFLADFPGKTVGVCFGNLLVEQLPTAKHDIPVQAVVTENGFLSLRAPERLTKAQAIRKRIGICTVRIGRFCKNEFLKLISVNPELPVSPIKPAVLAMTVFVLLGSFCSLEPILLTRQNDKFLVPLMLLLSFLVPSVLYLCIWNKGLYRQLRIRWFRPAHLWFAFCILMLVITGGMLGAILFGGIESLTGNFMLYGRFVSHAGGGLRNVWICIFVYGLLPAACEEFLFRGILMAEYEAFGTGTSIAVTSILFAMLQGSFALLIPNLLIGVLLGLSLYTARSLAVPFLIHFLYNLFCLFGYPFLSAFYTSAGSPELFLFLVTVLFLLFAAFAAGEGRKIYHIYAKRNLNSSYAPQIPWKNVPGVTLRTVFVWPYGVCLAISFLLAILNLI